MTKKYQQALDRLDELEAAFSGTIGVAAIGSNELSNRAPILRRETEVFPPASTIKVPLLYTCLRLVDSRALDLETRITLEEQEKVLGSGVLRDLRAGLQVTIHDLLTLMTIVSDNTATNMVIDLVGGPNVVNADLHQLGLATTRLLGKLMLPPERRNAEHPAGGTSATTPGDMVQLLQLMIEGDALTPTSRQVAHTIMLRQHYTDSLTRELPWPTTEPMPPWELAAKSGSIQGVRNQVGWLTHYGRRFYFAIFTKDCTDLRYYGENEGNLAVAKVFRVLFDYFMGD